MTESKDYDVLRVIEHKKHYYLSAENVKGHSLVGWIKYHPGMKKEQMLKWIGKVTDQLIQMHKYGEKFCYQYVNPYSLIVSEDGEIYFLDMNAKSNQGKVNIMNRRNIRCQFLPENEKYYQNVNRQLDLYGLGKTIQYILAFVRTEPALTRKEERILKKIVYICISQNSKKYITSIGELRKYLSKLQEK